MVVGFLSILISRISLMGIVPDTGLCVKLILIADCTDDADFDHRFLRFSQIFTDFLATEDSEGTEIRAEGFRHLGVLRRPSALEASLVAKG